MTKNKFTSLVVLGALFVCSQAYSADIYTAGTYYEVWRSETPSLAGATKIAWWLTDTTYVDDDATLQSGEDYYYWVRALDCDYAEQTGTIEKGYIYAEASILCPLSATNGYSSPVRVYSYMLGEYWNGDTIESWRFSINEQDPTFDEEIYGWNNSIFLDDSYREYEDWWNRDLPVSSYADWGQAEVYFNCDKSYSPLDISTVETPINVTIQANPPAGPSSSASQGVHSDKIVISWSPMVGVCSEIANTPYSVGWKTTSQTTSLTVTLNPSSGQWHLTSGPDTSWKNSGATISNLPTGDYIVEFEEVAGYITPPARPITIETGANSLTVSYQQGENLIPPWYDTYADSRYESSRFYSIQVLSLQSINSNICNAYIGFNLSDIPMGSTITSARLNIYSASSSGSVKVYEVTGNVSGGNEDSIDWAHQPSVNPSPIHSFNIIDNNGYFLNYFWICSNFVQGLVDDGDNFEISLRTIPGDYMDFASSEYSNSSERPSLEITYTPPPIGDLIVSSNQLSPSASTYDVGESVTCNVTIKNNSSTGYTESSDIEYYIGLTSTDLSHPFDGDGINALTPLGTDDESSSSYTFQSSDIGQRYIICKANPDGDIDEASYSNNIKAYGPFTVRQPAGNLCVTMAPLKVLEEQPRWRVDGGLWHTNDYTATNLSVGMHTVEFESTANWNASESQSVVIIDNQTALVDAHYYHITDISGDDEINLNDFSALASQWMNNCFTPDWCNGCDIDQSESVNSDDLLIMADNWLIEPDGVVFVSIPAGTFQMGDSFSEGYSSELPVHTVTLSSFNMSQYEITNGQYAAFLNSVYPTGIFLADGVVYHASDWHYSYPYCNLSNSFRRGQIDFSGGVFTVPSKGGRSMINDPVVAVSHRGAEAFCNYYGYRLPTEAEWEYAARGGLSGRRFPWGDTITHSQAIYNSSSSYSYDTSPTRGYHPTWNDGIWHYTSPVGSFPSNGYGLYDMAGNVWEWCSDWYGSYPSISQTNPTGPSTGHYRVIRGGSWYREAYICRVTVRSYDNQYLSFHLNHGFRVCLD